MKRSEDIQNTLSSGRFFSNVNKKEEGESRRSSISNGSSAHGVAESVPMASSTAALNYGSAYEYSAQPKNRSINASPKVAKEPHTLTD